MSNQSGDKQERAAKLASFEHAASPYFEDIRRFCISKAKNIQLGEDVAQEALVKAFNSWHTFEDQGAGPKAWMYKIAANALITAGIKQSKIDDKRVFVRQSESGATNFGFDQHDFKHSVDSPEIQIIEQFGLAEIEAAISGLDEEFREVAFLKFIVGMDNIEIAEELDLKQNTVGSRVSRSRAKLSEVLKDMAAGFGIGLDEDKKK
jgi:RNA polymerase sigma-70 factor (ECF subfamily)